MGKTKDKDKKEKKEKKKEKEREREEQRAAQPELIHLADLMSEERMRQIEENTRANLYISTDWSLQFYIAQAYHGFIAVAYEQAGRPSLLLPEMQFSYAVLRHEDLHISRKTRRRCSRYRLTIDQRLDEVLAGVRANHEHSWVIKEYETLLRVLIRRPIAVPVPGANAMLKVHSIELLDGDRVIAGELGYTIGAVYVSLTGFLDRKEVASRPANEAADKSSEKAKPASEATTPASEAAGKDSEEANKPAVDGTSKDFEEGAASVSKLKHDGAGTVQLVALGRLLQRCGFAFWDLGHPPQPKTETEEARMMYKAELGAKVLQRDEFLNLWKEARDAKPHTALNAAVGPDGVSAKDIICVEGMSTSTSKNQGSGGYCSQAPPLPLSTEKCSS